MTNGIIRKVNRRRALVRKAVNLMHANRLIIDLNDNPNNRSWVNADEGAPPYSGAELLGYCSKARTADTPRELRRLNSAEASDHFVSADPAEWEAAAADGYAAEGGCWIP